MTDSQEFSFSDVYRLLLRTQILDRNVMRSQLVNLKIIRRSVITVF